MEIRDAIDSDWAEIWALHGTDPCRRRHLLLATRHERGWGTDLVDGQGLPDGPVLVAIANGAVVGTAEIHPNQPAAGSHVANAGFMVAPSAGGNGRGTRAGPPRTGTCGAGWLPGDAVQRCRPGDQYQRNSPMGVARFQDPRHSPRGIPGNPEEVRSLVSKHHASGLPFRET